MELFNSFFATGTDDLNLLSWPTLPGSNGAGAREEISAPVPDPIMGRELATWTFLGEGGEKPVEKLAE
jgi:hypothetical protein